MNRGTNPGVRLKDGRMLRVGHAQAGDAAEIVAYVEQVGRETDFLTFGAGEFGMSVDEEARFIENLDDGRFNFMLKGVVDGAIVSVTTLMRSKRPRVRHVAQFGISVARSHWRLGVGRAMCLATIDLARLRGVTKVNLEVRDDHRNAIALYESVGFCREGACTRALKVHDRYYTTLMMGLSVN